MILFLYQYVSTIDVLSMPYGPKQIDLATEII